MLQPVTINTYVKIKDRATGQIVKDLGLVTPGVGLEVQLPSNKYYILDLVRSSMSDTFCNMEFYVYELKKTFVSANNCNDRYNAYAFIGAKGKNLNLNSQRGLPYDPSNLTKMTPRIEIIDGQNLQKTYYLVGPSNQETSITVSYGPVGTTVFPSS
ncbi:MAG TPA: hypothetical protein VJB89_03980 [Candidatus Nanoarchaeia archaeon]|nr:hypothetical protein [Candidatus Nanoarchaeia archaeon]